MVGSESLTIKSMEGGVGRTEEWVLFLFYLSVFVE